MKRSRCSKHSIQNTLFLIASTLALTSPAFAIEVQLSEAPTNDLELTVGAIKSAKNTLLLNIYELTSPDIADALINRIQAGVKVEILEEGSPVGGLSTAAKGVQAQISSAMEGRAGDHLYEMKSSAGGKRRYRFDHAKYAVIDDSALLIGSENYSPSGNPTPGSLGNRGWEVLIQDPSLAADYKNIFIADSNLSAGDVTDLTNNPQAGIQDAGPWDVITGGPGSGPHKPHPAPTKPKPTHTPHPKPTPTPTSTSGGGSGPVSGIPSAQADNIEKITSPDSSLSGIVDALNQAKTSIDIQQMTFDSAWKGAASSPIVDAVLAAAQKRGVRVRVLLNDDHVFDHPGHPAAPKNQTTVDLLNQAASKSGTNISAKIANLKGMGVDYIHNKGLLIDGNKTLISSINWDENSIQNNREAAVLITGTEVFNHYESLFEADWKVSGGNSLQVEFQNTLQVGSLQTDSVDCPDTIELNLNIGALTVDDSSDKDFLSLQNSAFKGTYVKSKNSSSCILTETPPSSGIMKKSFIEIKKSPSGTLSITFEAYTQKSGKLFSVRSRLLKDDTVSGKHDAFVYDASSPAREKIGAATIELQTQ